MKRMQPIRFNGKECTKEDCSMCEKCIFDEEDDSINRATLCNASIKDKNMANCNSCIFSKATAIPKPSGGIGLTNWYCCHQDNEKVIDLSLREGEKVQIPNWCPLVKTNDTAPTTTTETKKYRDMNYIDKRKMWEGVKVTSNWDNIKVGHIYHVPPTVIGTRKDILITHKTDIYLQYKELAKDHICCGVKNIYKSDIESKFIVPHKIQIVETNASV